jgi:hypothetical protein
LTEPQQQVLPEGNHRSATTTLPAFAPAQF